MGCQITLFSHAKHFRAFSGLDVKIAGANLLPVFLEASVVCLLRFEQDVSVANATIAVLVFWHLYLPTEPNENFEFLTRCSHRYQRTP
jgi:hypothetical protein